MKEVRILFLNPPGKKIFIRDYYCSKVSKAYYLPQPVDLLIQTGFFDEDLYELKVIDAIAEKLDVRNCLQEIKKFKPDVIVAQCGSVSFREDDLFFKELKAFLTQVKIFSSGDLFLENPQYFLNHYPWLEGIITDFFFDGVLRYIEGQAKGVKGLVLRNGMNGLPKTINPSTRVKIPLPRHHLFNNHLYRMPFSTRLPMATVLTNYACPYPCTFCIMSSLPYKTRSAEDVIEELLMLKNLGIRYLYFSDQTFFVNAGITNQVLDFMISEKLDFEWVCFSRVDLLDAEKMTKMKQAGCNVIMFGVEWAEDDYCEKYKKKYTTNQVRETFEIAKKVGIKRMGTFLIGVPGQSEESIRNTVQFAIDIDSDYASFNIAVPRARTSFREEALHLNLIKDEDRIMDQSGSFITMGTGIVNPERLDILKKEAYRKFYFRPSYISKRLTSIKNIRDFKNHVKEGFQVFKNTML